MSIIIDKEFQSLIPPLSLEEFQQLEENCVNEGIRDALIVWKQPDGNDILIDGHNRWNISVKHGGIPFQIKQMEFSDRDAVKLWIIRNQLGRRNISKWARFDLAKQLEKIAAKQAKERQGARTDIVPTLAPSNAGKTRDKMAEMVGVSHGTYDKMKAIDNSGDKQLISDVREGRETINGAYQKVHPKKTPQQRNKEFLEETRQAHKDFQSSKTVSINDIQADRTNRQIIAIDLCNRLMRMGKCIDDVAIDMEEGVIDLKEMSKSLTPESIKSLRTTIRFWQEKLSRIDREIMNG
jgi:hypothetical protein